MEHGKLNVDVRLSLKLPFTDSLTVKGKRHKQRTCKADNTDVRIVFLTVHEDPEFVHEVLSVGALGFVAKSCIASDLLFAINEAYAGRSFTSPSVTP